MAAPNQDPAKVRWFYITLSRLAASGGAVLGVILLAEGDTVWRRVLGGAIVLSAMAMMAIVPRSLAKRWRTPPE
ncbi:hypothetical protein ACM61V_17100 [Sphingomonas sp. TX0543]|uniref:hypothetical protein n=1 Tax=unclassified Sphingomonas TaxID=196159 RepID=UPI0010F587BA|nr:hypothetical protein [Sphingomonas sp. 3P27F8]